MKKVPPSEYVHHLNEALRKHPHYKDGMRFFVYPVNASDENVTGIAFEPYIATGLSTVVAQEVEKEYEVAVPGALGGGVV